MTTDGHEMDRRCAIRHKIVELCISDIRRRIFDDSPNQSQSERKFLELEIVAKLIDGQRIDAFQSMLLDEENKPDRRDTIRRRIIKKGENANDTERPG